MRGLCLCRTCQRISGGAGNLFIGLEQTAFRYTTGQPKLITGQAAGGSPTREFCGECGVHIAARSPKAPGGIIVKVGALDDPAAFGDPEMAFWTQEKQKFHFIAPGVRSFLTLPSR